MSKKVQKKKSWFAARTSAYKDKRATESYIKKTLKPQIKERQAVNRAMRGGPVGGISSRAASGIAGGSGRNYKKIDWRKK